MRSDWPRPSERPLTPRQARFVESFLNEAKFNASKAAALAGYRWPGKQGPRLLRFPNVNLCIEKGYAENYSRLSGRGCM